MGKTRVGVMLREGLGGNKSTSKSADLTALTQKYHEFAKRVNELIQVLQKHKDAMLALDETRIMVAQHFAGLTKATPLWESVGLMPSQDRPSNTVCSYSSVHNELSAKTKGYAVKYQQFVVDYAVEWEKVVTTRVNAGLKKAELLRRDLDHYQKKVESLRLSANQSMAKGKAVQPSTQEKLKRNEEKLVQAKQNYNKVATDLCILMEEVTERRWRDLHPLLVKCSQFDMTTAADESKMLSNLNRVVSEFKTIATTNGISPQPRLKDLSSLNPEMLSTRPGGVAGLSIEAAGSGLSSAGSGGGALSPLSGPASPSSPDALNPALPPGSTGSGGMGGFPIQVASLDHDKPSSSSALVTTTGGQGHNVSRTSSLSSFHSAPPPGSSQFEPPSTLSMLSISNAAAPPPTMEDVYSASAPTSGNLPPLHNSGAGSSSMVMNGYGRSGSMYSDPGGGGADNLSVGGGSSVYSAGSGVPLTSAPAAPPPPPPSMPPPPPPAPAPASMYGGQGMLGYHGSPSPSPYGAPPPPSQQLSMSSSPYGGGYPPMSSPPPGGPPPMSSPPPQHQQQHYHQAWSTAPPPPTAAAAAADPYR